MLKVDVLDTNRNKVGDAEVSPSIFEGKISMPLMHEMIVCQMANKRRGTHSCKTRAEVRGGGRKPWKQKGTGRARAGSSRSPLFRGGGVIFGPKPRDYSYKLPKQARRAALISAISMKMKEGTLTVVDKISIEEPKTKKAMELLGSLGVSSKTLFVAAQLHTPTLLSFRNIQGVKILTAEKLNVYDVVNSDQVVIVQEALTALHERLLK
ncbi:MAG: 50S ribosomal protein L4 [Nitrospinota bacterium]|nr:50S ribosomal protein L4 [Nitrospinota bacterium]